MTTQPPVALPDSAMTPTETRLVPVEPTWKTALLELKDKLWVARCNSNDEGFRACAERAIKMADEADWSPLASALPPREEAPEGVEKWITGDQLHEIMVSFEDRADVSEIADRINAAITLRAQPQPEQGEASGETREAVARIIAPKEWALQDFGAHGFTSACAANIAEPMERTEIPWARVLFSGRSCGR